MLINPDNLITIATYAKMRGLTTARIYQIRNKLNIVMIDGFKFVDKNNPLKTDKLTKTN